jgi:hypothetical protein
MKYFPSLSKFPSVFLALLVVLAFSPWALALDAVYIGPDLGNWNVAANWTGGFIPDQGFNEAGVVNNGATVVLDAHTQSPPGTNANIAGLRLGSLLATNTGGLRIVWKQSIRPVTKPAPSALAASARAI